MENFKRACERGSYIKKTFIRLELGAYWFWAALRVVLTLIPQTGYIHPDEYFQSVEVFAGNVFQVEASIPWEYNTTTPIRSITMMYITTSLPLSFLKYLTNFFGVSIVTPYIVLIFPRLTICILSFISDYCLYRICYLYGQNFRRRLLIFASSYVTLIYSTRTFSNTVEIILFNTLLYLVSCCMAESEKINYQDEFLIAKYEEATSTADRVRIWKLRKLLPAHSINRCFPIALVTTAGVFNRPTFLTYAIPPLFYWLQRGIKRNNSLLHFHSRFFLLLLYAMPVICVFIFLDSAYYGFITWGEILNLRLTIDCFVVTPLNFLRYNLDQANLSEHGLHPRWLHIAVNLPLLFNILALAGILVMANMLHSGSQSYWSQLPKPQSITGMMTLSFIVPVVALSAIPHQEPRFIAPVLLPLVFLYSHLITRFVEDCPAPAKRPIVQKQLHFLSSFDNRPNITGRFLTLINSQAVTGKPATGMGRFELLDLWFAINLVFVAFYGFIHQGGVYPLAKSFHNQLATQPMYTTYHLLYSHTYTFPQHLLIQRKQAFNRISAFSISELTTDTDRNIERISDLLKTAEDLKVSRKRSYRMFYAMPASALTEFEISHTRIGSNFSYNVIDSFMPHFSLEAPFKMPDVLSLSDVLSCFKLILLEMNAGITR